MAATTITVSTATELRAAIVRATGGETILLAPGNYGAVTISHRNPSSVVTLKSADPDRNAVLTDLKLDSSSRFSFHDLDVEHILKAGEPTFVAAVTLNRASNISFVGLDVFGTDDGTPWNDGVGVSVRASRNVMLTYSTFTELNRAAVFNDTDGIVAAGNAVGIVREGFNFAAVAHVLVGGNSFADFRPNYAAGDHSDAIQFWNNGVARGSSDVIIRDNVILPGANGGTQGIFIRAENLALKHSDFLIDNNLYYGDALNSISLLGVEGAVVRGNTVITAPGGALEAAIRIEDSARVLVERNISPLFMQDDNRDVVMVNNIDVWDTRQKRGIAVDELFTDATPGVWDHGDFAVRAGSAAAAVGAGFAAVGGIGLGSALTVHAAVEAAYAGLLATLDGGRHFIA